MTRHPKGKVRKMAAAALIGAAAVTVPLTADASVAQRHARGGVVVLSTSVTVINTHGRATITAVVRPPTLVFNGGVVTFVNQTTHKTLGTAPLRKDSGAPCTRTARECRARLTVSGRKLRRGVNHIIGLFNPHQLYKPSFRGRTLLYRGVSPACHPRRSTLPVFTASTRATLCRGRVSFGSGTSATATSRNRTVVTRNTVIAFGSQRLPCTTPHTGDLVAFSISGGNAPGSLAFQVVGRSATIAHAAHPRGYSCYESTIPFRTASGARAKRLADGSYYGSLPHCRDNDGDDVYPRNPNGDDRQVHPAPCIEWQQLTHRHGQAVWTVWIEPTTGDPRHSF